MNITFGAPFGARTATGHAGVDSSAVRPMTPGNDVPAGYSFNGISTLLIAGLDRDLCLARTPTHHPEGVTSLGHRIGSSRVRQREPLGHQGRRLTPRRVVPIAHR